MSARTPPRGNFSSNGRRHSAGAALPVALILLVGMCIAAVLASRRAAGLEEVSNNARTSQVAQLAAQSALRYCEAVVVDIVDNGGATHGALATKLGSTVLDEADHAAAAWRVLANWAPGATHRIDVPVASQDASVALGRVPTPQCMAEPMTRGRYLVTARGLSANATVNANGQLITGAEIWLQSVLSPNLPTLSAAGGFE